MTQPQRIVAGDSYAWSVAISDYPADAGWVLTYTLTPRGFTAPKQTITCTADGSDHAATLTAVASSSYIAGEYEVVGYVTLGANRHTVLRSRITVDPNPAAPETVDYRTWLEKTITALEASITGVASAQYQTMTVLGKTLGTMSLKEKLDMRDRLRSELQQISRARSGAFGRRIQCRFVQPNQGFEATPEPQHYPFTP